MEVPFPDGGESNVSALDLGLAVALAAGAAVWMYRFPVEAWEHPEITWTVPVMAVGLYCLAKGWRLGTGLNALVGAYLLGSPWLPGIVSVDGRYYAVIGLGTAGVTVVSAVTLVVARRRWRKTFADVAKDPESGLVRRWLFDWYLQKAVASGTRGKTLSLVVFGFQAFDQSEDWVGGDAEAHLIQEIGTLIQETSRNEDFLARYDRRRFVALLYGEDAESAAAYAERIRRQVEFADSLTEKGCIASAGVAEFDSDAFATPEEFSQAASRALASADYAGGNRVVVFGSKAFRAFDSGHQHG